MIKCEWFSHLYFATPPITRSCAYLDSFGKFGFRDYIGLQKWMSGPDRVRASNRGPLTSLFQSHLEDRRKPCSRTLPAREPSDTPTLECLRAPITGCEAFPCTQQSIKLDAHGMRPKRFLSACAWFRDVTSFSDVSGMVCVRVEPVSILTHQTHFHSNADHTRRIRKGCDVTKSDACAQKTHRTHAVCIQLEASALTGFEPSLPAERCTWNVRCTYPLLPSTRLDRPPAQVPLFKSSMWRDRESNCATYPVSLNSIMQ